ncbi:MAG: 8-oxo-dGTP diphosphatase [Clostridiales bacterium]|nr:8-oxo-dGTP diphosphatase [Clostridiales bacterium]
MKDNNVNEPKKRASLVEIVNMTMIEDKTTGKVLVLNKTKNWPGLTFPGGHVEPGEPFYESAVREVKEETGLEVKNLVSRGVVHWANKENGERYLEYLYSTLDFSGTLIKETEEGTTFWMTFEELKKSTNLSPNFDMYLPIFENDKYIELYLDWNGVDWDSKRQYFISK